MEWAIIAPDEARGPLDAPLRHADDPLKRGLVRLLRQYLNEVNAQQTRFNVQVAAYSIALEHVIRLEQRLERR